MNAATPDTSAAEEDLSAEEEASFAEDLSAEEETPARGPWGQVYDPWVETPEGVLARAQIRGGAILVGSGGLLLAGAIAVGLSDPCSRAGGNSCSGASRNRAAITMALPAAAMLAAGGALLGVGLRHRRELRAAASASGEGAYVALYGRF